MPPKAPRPIVPKYNPAKSRHPSTLRDATIPLQILPTAVALSTFATALTLTYQRHHHRQPHPDPVLLSHVAATNCLLATLTYLDLRSIADEQDLSEVPMQG